MPETIEKMRSGGEIEPGARTHLTGILPSQELRTFAAGTRITSSHEITEDMIQPASLDLRLGSVAYRVRASFLPGSGVPVSDKVAALGMHEIDLKDGAVFEKGCVYIVPLMESLHLDKQLSGMANPKSSSGRLDIFTRLITDGATEFERVRPGYKGPLYAEISPRAFSVVLHEGTSLNQLRLRRGNPPATDAQMQRLHDVTPLVDAESGQANIENGVAVSVDLEGNGAGSLIGYRAKRHTALIDVAKINHYNPADFWEPIYQEKGGLLLNPGDFYILMSREAVTVPPDHAAEMTAYDTLVGEFRVHYAGFFDPGFGFAASGGAGSRAVLEVRSHEVPFVLEHSQVVGRLVYERLTAVPDKIYGTDIGSNYQRQGLALAKQFIKPE